MQSRTLEKSVLAGTTGNPTMSVLLVDPDHDLRDSRRLLLSSRNISVLTISSYAEVYQLSEHGGYNLIVLSIRPNEIQACHVAEYARRRWPKARLLLLGDSCGCLDDPLYDEIVNPSGNPSGFIEAAERLLESVRTAWRRANTAKQRMSVTAELLKQANTALDLADTRYRLGLSSIVELSQAQLQQTQAQIAEANPRFDYEANLAALRFQSGSQP